LHWEVEVQGMPCGGAPDWEDKLPDEISDTIFCRSKAAKSSCQKSNVQICKESKKKQVRFCWFPQLAYSKHFSQRNPTPTGPTAQRDPVVPVRLRMALQREYEMNK